MGNVNTYNTRSDGIQNQNELTKEALQHLGGTRISFSNRSSILPITTKEFLDKSTIYSPSKSPAIKASLKWEEKEIVFHQKENTHYPELRNLEELLLSFGGNEVCIPDGYEEDYENIMEYGQFWYGRGAEMMKGVPSQCHKNSCDLWEANEDFTKICTGYALSDDGIWRQHSWVIDFRGASNKIIETTERRVAYFGFIMDYEDCQDFVAENF